MAEHFHKPQTLMRMDHAFKAIEQGLGELASMGHPFHLEAGTAPVEEFPWPRVYFHVDSAPNGRMVASPWELAELGAGWFPTLQEAQHDDGMKTQFAGRGGVGRRDLPTVVAGAPAAVESLDARREQIKREFLARRTARAPSGKDGD